MIKYQSERIVILFTLLCLLLVVSCAPGRFSKPAELTFTLGKMPEAAIDSVLQDAKIMLRRKMTGELRGKLQSLLDIKKLDPQQFAQINKLLAESHKVDGNLPEAARYYRQLAERFPDSTGFHSAYWRSLTQWAEEDTSNAGSLNNLIRAEASNYTTSNTKDALFLSYIAAQLLNDSSANAQADRLIEKYPASQEATDIIGSRFWDGLYPIWTNDSAKTHYLHDFIHKYSANSWVNYGYRNLVVTYLALKDTTAAAQAAYDWIAREPMHPPNLSIAGSYLLDIPQGADSARTWIERAYQYRSKVVRPSYVTPEEWLLYEQQTKALLPLLMAEIRLRAGNLKEARKFAEESLALAVYDLDDNNTAAPQNLTLGRIAHLEGNLAETAHHWTQAAILGDVYDRFAGRAIDSLKVVFNLMDYMDLMDFCRERTKYTGLKFDRVTVSVGLDSARGSRIAWGDYDNDGDDDLLCGGSRLFSNDNINDSILFIERTHQSQRDKRRILSAEGCHGGIWGDADSDGDLDLFCFSSSSDTNKAEKFFRNSTFYKPNPFSEYIHPILEGGYFPLADSFSTEAAIWFDANGDGRLDLFIPGYEKPAKGAGDLGNAWPSRLLIQDSTGIFHDSTAAFGLIPPNERNLCARSPVACDFDRDGDQDLYVGNYRLQENIFWINNDNDADAAKNTPNSKFQIPNSDNPKSKIQNPKFTNRAAFYGVDGAEVEGWWGHTIGCQWGDFDGDGDFDLIACNLAHPRYIGFSNRTMLYRNDLMENGRWKMEQDTSNPKSKIQNPKSELPFVDVRKQWGIKYEECHSEPVWGDFDNDGDLDLFITCVYPNRRSFLYENKGDHFEDVTFLSGTRIFNGWGCATADYDNDGRLDLAVCESGKVELFRNVTEKVGNWVEVVSNRKPNGILGQIGDIVEVKAGEKSIIRQFEGGKGAGSQNSNTLHFGIGDASECKVILYSLHDKRVYTGVAANSRFRLKETKP